MATLASIAGLACRLLQAWWDAYWRDVEDAVARYPQHGHGWRG